MAASHRRFDGEQSHNVCGRCLGSWVVLFQLITGELPFRPDKLTGSALLAAIGEVIGDLPIDVLTFLKISAGYSYLLRQRIRP
jgi:hypothetical protein